MTTAIIIIVLFGGCFFLAYKMMDNQKKVIEKYESPVMVNQAVNFNKELLEHDLELLAEQFPNHKIDAITECAYISDLSSKAKDIAGKAFKTVALAAVGVKTRYVQVANAAYLVLIGDELHYILFEEGEVTDHLILPKEVLEKAKVEVLNNVDKVSRMFATAGGKQSRKLVLDMDGNTFDIIFYDRIQKEPSGYPVGRSKVKEVYGKMRVAGIDFEKKLKERFSNIKY
ncbi:hypothetical protein [Myroides injenensis]|uniref:hypothetical protein n=1 Tax=Myroides injenensis TaxID=1183151 RepID=UPI0002891CAC|nr:hypothetical protein [Myroides injenensis]